MEPVFIVGQYKSGTSWLLSAMSAHPKVIGLAEIDVIRAVYDIDSERPRPAERSHRLEYFFGRAAWCNQNMVEILEEGRDWSLQPRSLDQPQGFFCLQPSVAQRLYRRIGEAASPNAALEAFHEAAETLGADQTHIVYKAADQIAVFDLLDAWHPHARKIVITRDGRDAAISAQHYRKLVEDRAWFGGHLPYETLLRGWAERAHMVAREARAGKVWLLRYEDLTEDFSATLTPLLAWLGLDATPEVVDAIEQASSFEASTGRPRGSEGTGIVRKGAVGEWMEALDDGEQAEAWSIAGPALTRLGYTATGELQPIPVATRGRAAMRVRDGAVRLILLAGLPGTDTGPVRSILARLGVHVLNETSPTDPVVRLDHDVYTALGGSPTRVPVPPADLAPIGVLERYRPHLAELLEGLLPAEGTVAVEDWRLGVLSGFWEEQVPVHAVVVVVPDPDRWQPPSDDPARPPAQRWLEFLRTVGTVRAGPLIVIHEGLAEDQIRSRLLEAVEDAPRPSHADDLAGFLYRTLREHPAVTASLLTTLAGSDRDAPGAGSDRGSIARSNRERAAATADRQRLLEQIEDLVRQRDAALRHRDEVRDELTRQRDAALQHCDEVRDDLTRQRDAALRHRDEVHDDLAGQRDVAIEQRDRITQERDAARDAYRAADEERLALRTERDELLTRLAEAEAGLLGRLRKTGREKD